MPNANREIGVPGRQQYYGVFTFIGQVVVRNGRVWCQQDAECSVMCFACWGGTP